MTIDINLSDLVNLTNDTTAVSSINNNSALITTAFSSALDTSGDQMHGNLDLNSFQIINLPSPATANSPARLQDLATLNGSGKFFNIPAGGSAGDALVKSSSTDYAVEWSPQTADISAGTGITVSGANPTVINLSTPVSLGNGGLGASLVASQGAVFYSTLSGAALVNTANSTNVLISGPSSPSWTSLSGLVSASTNISISGNTNLTISTVTSPTFTSVTAPTLVVSSSETLPDNSVWSSTGITNSSGVVYSITSAGGLNIYGLSGSNAGATFNNFGANGIFTHQTASGTMASPTAIASGQTIGTFSWNGYNGTSYVGKARILGGSSETGPWTATSNGCFIEFDTTASGSASRVQAMRIMAGVNVGTATTDPGAGNLSVSGTITTVSSSTATLTVTSTATFLNPFILPKYTVTALPSGSTGMIAMVTDATTSTFATTVVGGGTGKVLVLYTGTVWIEV